MEEANIDFESLFGITFTPQNVPDDCDNYKKIVKPNTVVNDDVIQKITACLEESERLKQENINYIQDLRKTRHTLLLKLTECETWKKKYHEINTKVIDAEKSACLNETLVSARDSVIQQYKSLVKEKEAEITLLKDQNISLKNIAKKFNLEENWKNKYINVLKCSKKLSLSLNKIQNCKHCKKSKEVYKRFKVLESEENYSSELDASPGSVVPPSVSSVDTGFESPQSLSDSDSDVDRSSLRRRLTKRNSSTHVAESASSNSFITREETVKNNTSKCVFPSIHFTNAGAEVEIVVGGHKETVGIPSPSGVENSLHFTTPRAFALDKYVQTPKKYVHASVNASCDMVSKSIQTHCIANETCETTKKIVTATIGTDPIIVQEEHLNCSGNNLKVNNNKADPVHTGLLTDAGAHCLLQPVPYAKHRDFNPLCDSLQGNELENIACRDIFDDVKTQNYERSLSPIPSLLSPLPPSPRSISPVKVHIMESELKPELGSESSLPSSEQGLSLSLSSDEDKGEQLQKEKEQLEEEGKQQLEEEERLAEEEEEEELAEEEEEEEELAEEEEQQAEEEEQLVEEEEEEEEQAEEEEQVEEEEEQQLEEEETMLSETRVEVVNAETQTDVSVCLCQSKRRQNVDIAIQTCPPMFTCTREEINSTSRVPFNKYVGIRSRKSISLQDNNPVEGETFWKRLALYLIRNNTGIGDENVLLSMGPEGNLHPYSLPECKSSSACLKSGSLKDEINYLNSYGSESSKEPVGLQSIKPVTVVMSKKCYKIPNNYFYNKKEHENAIDDVIRNTPEKKRCISCNSKTSHKSAIGSRKKKHSTLRRGYMNKSKLSNVHDQHSLSQSGTFFVSPVEEKSHNFEHVASSVERSAATAEFKITNMWNNFTEDEDRSVKCQDPTFAVENEFEVNNATHSEKPFSNTVSSLNPSHSSNCLLSEIDFASEKQSKYSTKTTNEVPGQFHCKNNLGNEPLSENVLNRSDKEVPTNTKSTLESSNDSFVAEISLEGLRCVVNQQKSSATESENSSHSVFSQDTVCLDNASLLSYESDTGKQRFSGTNLLAKIVGTKSMCHSLSVKNSVIESKIENNNVNPNNSEILRGMDRDNIKLPTNNEGHEFSKISFQQQCKATKTAVHLPTEYKSYALKRKILDQACVISMNKKKIRLEKKIKLYANSIPDANICSQLTLTPETSNLTDNPFCRQGMRGRKKTVLNNLPTNYELPLDDCVPAKFDENQTGYIEASKKQGRVAHVPKSDKDCERSDFKDNCMTKAVNYSSKSKFVLLPANQPLQSSETGNFVSVKVNELFSDMTASTQKYVPCLKTSSPHSPELITARDSCHTVSSFEIQETSVSNISETEPSKLCLSPFIHEDMCNELSEKVKVNSTKCSKIVCDIPESSCKSMQSIPEMMPLSSNSVNVSESRKNVTQIPIKKTKLQKLKDKCVKLRKLSQALPEEIKLSSPSEKSQKAMKKKNSQSTSKENCLLTQFSDDVLLRCVENCSGNHVNQEPSEENKAKSECIQKYKMEVQNPILGIQSEFMHQLTDDLALSDSDDSISGQRDENDSGNSKSDNKMNSSKTLISEKNRNPISSHIQSSTSDQNTHSSLMNRNLEDLHNKVSSSIENFEVLQRDDIDKEARKLPGFATIAMKSLEGNGSCSQEERQSSCSPKQMVPSSCLRNNQITEKYDNANTYKIDIPSADVIFRKGNGELGLGEARNTISRQDVVEGTKVSPEIVAIENNGIEMDSPLSPPNIEDCISNNASSCQNIPSSPVRINNLMTPWTDSLVNVNKSKISFLSTQDILSSPVNGDSDGVNNNDDSNEKVENISQNASYITRSKLRSWNSKKLVVGEQCYENSILTRYFGNYPGKEKNPKRNSKLMKLKEKVEENFQSLLNEYVSSELTDAILSNTVNVFKKIPKIHINIFVKCVVRCVKYSAREPYDYSNPNAAPLTTTQKHLITLVVKLEDYHPTVVIDLLKRIHFVVCDYNHHHYDATLFSLARFFLAFCKLRNNKEWLQVFAYDALYCLKLRGYGVFHAIITGFPDVFPKAGRSASESVLVKTLVYVIFTYGCASYLKTSSIRSFFSIHYGYERHKLPTLEALLKCLMADIKKGSSLDAEQAILILSKFQNDWEWTYNKLIKGCLFPIIDSWKLGNATENIAIASINLIAYLAKTPPFERNDALSIMDMFEKMLSSSTCSSRIKEACINGVVSLVKVNENKAFGILRNCKSEIYLENSQNLQETLNSVFQKRSDKWWKKFLNTS